MWETKWEKKKRGHAYIWDLGCLIFSYFASENMNYKCPGFWWKAGIHIEHFRINVSDTKIEQYLDDSMSSSNSKYMIELSIVYIVQVVWKYVRNWRGIKVFNCYVKSSAQIELDCGKFWFYAPDEQHFID